MADENDIQRLISAIVEGLYEDGVKKENILTAIKQIEYLGLLSEGTTFLRELIITETPSEPDAIRELSKEEVIFATYRANFFEKIKIPVFTDDQLKHLILQSDELWGEHPTEPLGRWTKWCLWTHLNRRQNRIPITEVIEGTKNAEDLKQAWINRHQSREERRRLQKVDHYDQYDIPQDVPRSIREILMGPFMEESK